MQVEDFSLYDIFIDQYDWVNNNSNKIYLGLHHVMEFHYLRYILLRCLHGRLGAVANKITWLKCVCRFIDNLSQSIPDLWIFSFSCKNSVCMIALLISMIELKAIIKYILCIHCLIEFHYLQCILLSYLHWECDGLWPNYYTKLGQAHSFWNCKFHLFIYSYRKKRDFYFFSPQKLFIPFQVIWLIFWSE